MFETAKMDLTTDSKDQGTGQPVLPAQLTEENLTTIGQRLTNEDVVKMKFLCKEWIEDQKWPTIKLFSDLISCLKQEHTSNIDFRNVVIELLYIIRRYDLLKVLGSCKHAKEHQEHHLVNGFWKSWYELVEGIDVDKASLRDVLDQPLKRVDPEYRKQLLEPLRDLLGDQGRMLYDLQYQFEGEYNDYYPIRKFGTYGLCIIINNKQFPVKEEVREGTDIDKWKLTHLFESFDFKVEAKDDLKAKEMKDWILAVAKRNHTLYDCFVCWILSHGSEGNVQGINTDEPKHCTLRIIEDLVHPFCETAETLRGKPKLFFINACQGTEEQSVVEIPTTKEPEEELQTDSSERPEGTVPLISDYLLAMPTIPGYVAYRHKKTGAWYVNAFCEEFHDFGGMEDVVSVLTRVNDKVTGSVATRKKECGQAPAATVVLRKKVFLRKKRQPQESE